MKIDLQYAPLFLVAGALLLAASMADARPYDVSSSSKGRGTKYTTERGGSAYVGPRGTVAQGADGRTAAAGRRGAAVAGPNGAAAVRTTRTVHTDSTAVVTSQKVVTTLPAGYIRTVPAGYKTIAYRGYTCRYVGGVYYRPVFYGGSTVYVVVR